MRDLQKRSAVIFTHPDNAVNAHTWDRQFCKYNHHEFDQWVETERRPIGETKRFYENMCKLVRMIKNDKRFHITTFSEYAKRLESEPKRTVTLADIPALREAIGRELYPTKTPLCLSLSDMAYACRDLLMRKERHECGKVYGFLDTPFAITEPVTLCAEDVRASATQIGHRFLPASITVGNRTIGPADWLRAALGVLCGEEHMTVLPAPQMPSLAVFDVVPRLDTVNFKGKWMFSDDFEDRYLSDRLRLQCWTMRFPEI